MESFGWQVGYNLVKLYNIMKIGLVSFHTFSQPGGVKKHILGLADEFKRRGIEVKIIVPRRKKSENYGKDVILLGTSIAVNFAGTQGDLYVNLNPMKVGEVLEKEKFDILHFHNFGFPSVFEILERSEALNILTFHANLERNNFLEQVPGLMYLFNKIIQRKMAGVIGVAKLNLEAFKYYEGPKRVIPNGIDLKEFEPEGKKITKFLDGKINILFLGRIEERKGLIYLLRAFKILEKKYPDKIRLIVVGDGPLKKECQEWVKKNNLKNVVFEMKIKEAEASLYYRTCDIFCSPAIYGESFGIVLVEAMATGKPVVAFANKGYKGVLEGGRGKRFLVRPKDYRTLAGRIGLLIRNESLRKEMGKWGLAEAKKYAWSKIADQVLGFYDYCQKNIVKRK
ncbi:MAG: glycosyltransferase family 4 protein [Candidatus Nealsonbacteria bacterium]